MRNKNLQSFIVLLAGIGLLIATSLLLDLEFIKKQFVRQIIVYFVMAFQAFVMFRIWKNIYN